MEIIVAKTAGFCFGVKRAIGMAYNAAKDAHKTVHTLGPLIHNPQVVKDLELSGVFAVDCIEDIKDDSPLIIRSHGITLAELNDLRARGISFIDATCPFVRRAQGYVKELSDAGYFIVVVGEKDHPEVKGLISYAGSEVKVVSNEGEAKDIPRMKRVGIVAQTTQSLDNLQAVLSELLPRVSELRVYNTICNATTIRQNESTDIARKVDCMIVVGGFNSANTKRLTRMCRSIQPNTHQIEVADDIIPAWLDGVERVGVTAGASTPSWIIEDVIKRIETISKG